MMSYKRMSSIAMIASVACAGVLGFITAGLDVSEWIPFAVIGLYVAGTVPANIFLYQIQKNEAGHGSAP